MAADENKPPRPDLSIGAGATAIGLSVTLAAGLTALAWAAVQTQARGTTRRIEDAAVQAAVAAGVIQQDSGGPPVDIQPPDGDGSYRPDGTMIPDQADGTAIPGQPHELPEGDAGGRTTSGLALAMLGDSTAVGYGTVHPDHLPGVLLARRVAADLGVPVRLGTFGRVGAASAELPDQVSAALVRPPDLVVIVIGANDITEQVPPHRAAHQLGAAVARLRAEGVQVVVATCPDFGVIAPIPQPLRLLVTRWSQRLAALQDKAVRTADGVPIAIGRLVSPSFRDRPDLFYADGFHPSAAGYARAMEVMTPDVIAAARRALAGQVSADRR